MVVCYCVFMVIWRNIFGIFGGNIVGIIIFFNIICIFLLNFIL